MVRRVEAATNSPTTAETTLLLRVVRSFLHDVDAAGTVQQIKDAAKMASLELDGVAIER